MTCKQPKINEVVKYGVRQLNVDLCLIPFKGILGSTFNRPVIDITYIKFDPLFSKSQFLILERERLTPPVRKIW